MYCDVTPILFFDDCGYFGHSKKRGVFTAIPQIVQMESDYKAHGIAHGLPILDFIISEVLGSGDAV